MRRSCLAVLLIMFTLTAVASGQESATGISPSGSHPLAKVLNYAVAQHELVQKNIRDYTCVIVKRERIDGEMQDYQFMTVKARLASGQEQGRMPFAAHVMYVKPASVASRTIEYIQGENDNKMLVRLRKGGVTLRINLDSPRALQESTVSITTLSFSRMLSDIVARIQSDMKADPQGENTEVDIAKGATINDRSATVVVVRHPNRGKDLTFCEARMFIDDQWRMPTRVEVYDWPAKPGGEPVLTGEFTYLNLRVNVDLPDSAYRELYVPGSSTGNQSVPNELPR